MSARLLVDAAGPGVTVQDEGRFGLSRYGVTPAGPMDLGAYLAATRAAGADSAIEVSLGGAAFRAEGATLCVAVAGGAFDVRLDGRPLPPACLLPLAPELRLVLRAGASGAWCYVAVGGTLDLAPVLGARATHARSGLGPKPLAAGDALPFADAAAGASRAAGLDGALARVERRAGPPASRASGGLFRARGDRAISECAVAHRRAQRSHGLPVRGAGDPPPART